MRPAGSREERLAGSTARVSRRWPRVPFWLQRGSAHESGAALPGAAVSATATLAVLVYEPGWAGSVFRALAPDFFGHPAWLAAVSLIAPLATLLILGKRGAATPAARWLAMLPVYGLFAVARALTEADAAGRDRRPPPPLPAAEGHEPARRPLSLPLLARFGPHRAGLSWQALLFGSHLGWLFSAAARLAAGSAPAASRVAGFAALHLLAMAAAQLMMEHEGRRRALLPAGWANRLAPFLLLLPAPANLLAAFCWMLPRWGHAGSLAAFVFAAQSPLQRLAAFRTLLPARTGLSPFFESWSAGDPFAHLAAARRRREQPWIALHRLVFALQAAAAARLLAFLGTPLDTWVLGLSGSALAGAGLMLVSQGALLLAGFSAKSSGLIRLGRASGISFALGFGLAAGLVSTAAPDEAARLWTTMLLTAAVAMLLRLPIEILGAPEKLKRVPPSILSGLAFGVASIGLQLLQSTISGPAVASAFEWSLVASPLLSPLLVYLAAETSAPPLAAARWLSVPGSAILLPFRRDGR